MFQRLHHWHQQKERQPVRSYHQEHFCKANSASCWSHIRWHFTQRFQLQSTSGRILPSPSHVRSDDNKVHRLKLWMAHTCAERIHCANMLMRRCMNPAWRKIGVINLGINKNWEVVADEGSYLNHWSGVPLGKPVENIFTLEKTTYKPITYH